MTPPWKRYRRSMDRRCNPLPRCPMGPHLHFPPLLSVGPPGSRGRGRAQAVSRLQTRTQLKRTRTRPQGLPRDAARSQDTGTGPAPAAPPPAHSPQPLSGPRDPEGRWGEGGGGGGGGGGGAVPTGAVRIHPRKQGRADRSETVAWQLHAHNHDPRQLEPLPLQLPPHP